MQDEIRCLFSTGYGHEIEQQASVFRVLAYVLRPEGDIKKETDLMGHCLHVVGLIKLISIYNQIIIKFLMERV
jgi:hypothetical protein